MTRILLLEDDDNDAYLFRKNVPKDTHIINVETISEALLVPDSDFDLIVSDLSLRDGYASGVIDRLKMGFPNKPLIVLSGLGLASDETEIENHMKFKGVFAFVHKKNRERIKPTIEELKK